jgi:uncharacterized protein with HEPN domain
MKKAKITIPRARLAEFSRRWNISPQTRKKYPQIPWRDMTLLRNLVIHQYDAVDINQVWDTTQHKLPPLVAELLKIVPLK